MKLGSPAIRLAVHLKFPSSSQPSLGEWPLQTGVPAFVHELWCSEASWFQTGPASQRACRPAHPWTPLLMKSWTNKAHDIHGLWRILSVWFNFSDRIGFAGDQRSSRSWRNVPHLVLHQTRSQLSTSPLFGSMEMAKSVGHSEISSISNSIAASISSRVFAGFFKRRFVPN